MQLHIRSMDKGYIDMNSKCNDMTPYTLSAEQLSFQRKMTNPWLIRLFFLFKIPLGFLSGMKVTQISAQKATATVNHRWLNQNPFGSMYFAVQCMAAEISTGVIALTAVRGQQPTIAAIVTGCDSVYFKQVKSRIYFVCEEGDSLFEAVEKCKDNQEGQSVRVKTTGRTKDGTVVSEFHFTWSFKQRLK